MIFKTDSNQEFYTPERCFITEILNNDQLKDLSIVRARVEPGITTELHKLKVNEVYYILEGEGMMEINGINQGRVSKSDVVYIQSGVSQRITNLTDSDLIFLCICHPKFTKESYTNLESQIN